MSKLGVWKELGLRDLSVLCNCSLEGCADLQVSELGPKSTSEPNVGRRAYFASWVVLVYSQFCATFTTIHF